MANTIEILIPTAEPKIKTIAVNSRLNDLNGKIVGFLWNEKPNGDILLQRIKDHLSQRFNLADTVWGQVEAVHIPAEDAPEVKQLGTKADAVVIATGDWGACTTWSIHAAAVIEKMGKHTVTICTDRFEILAQITGQGIGMPDLPLVVVSHPIGGISPEEVKIKADNIIEKIIDRLVQ